METLTDVWKLETGDEEMASEDLNMVIDNAMKFTGTRERNYLKGLWPECSWKTIRERLDTEGSVWYVFYMDGVRQHLINLQNECAV